MPFLDDAKAEASKVLTVLLDGHGICRCRDGSEALTGLTQVPTEPRTVAASLFAALKWMESNYVQKGEHYKFDQDRYL